jgi:hypothetical protein
MAASGVVLQQEAEAREVAGGAIGAKKGTGAREKNRWRRGRWGGSAVLFRTGEHWGPLTCGPRLAVGGRGAGEARARGPTRKKKRSAPSSDEQEGL